jgi:hypothetical protein
MYPLGTMVWELSVQNEKTVMKIMCLVGRNLVQLWYCRISIGGIGLDFWIHIYVCAWVNMLLSILQERNSKEVHWKKDTSEQEVKDSDRYYFDFKCFRP